MNRFISSFRAFTTFLTLGIFVYASLSSAQEQFIWPTAGSITSNVGNRLHPVHGDYRYHAGIDIGADYGAPVLAAANGRVVSAGPNGGAGNTIVIEHSNGYRTRYAHLNTIEVGVGDTVTVGSRIAGVGSTGYSTGPHLHLEIYQNGTLLTAFGDNVSVGQYVSPPSTIPFNFDGLDAGVPPDDIQLGQGGDEPNFARQIAEFALGDEKSLLDRLAPNAKQWFGRTVNFVEGKRGEAINDGLEFDVNGGTVSNNVTLTYGRAGDVTAPNLFKAFINLGWALTFALFVYAIANANYFYRSDDYWRILGRLIIAVGLLTGSPAISSALGTSWLEMHDFTQEKFAVDTNLRLGQAVLSIGTALPSFLTGLAAVDKLEEITTGGFSGDKKTNNSKARAAAVIRMSLLVIILMYGLHVVTVYSTGLIFILGMLFLPLSAALLLWPGMGSYLSRWASMILTAFATLVISIIIYAMAMDIAFVIPLNNLADGLEQTGQEIQNLFSAIIPDIDKIGDNPNVLEALGNWLKEIGGKFVDVSVTATNTLVLFIFNGVFMIVGVVVGLFLLTNFERFVAGFFGGVASSGANALLGAAGFAVGQLSASQGANSSGGGGDNSLNDVAEASLGSPSSQANGQRAGSGGGNRAGSQPALPSGTSSTSGANNIVSFSRRGSPTTGSSGGSSAQTGGAAGEIGEAVAENPEVLALL